MFSRDGFDIVIASPSDHEELVAEIYFRGKFFAQISQERGAGVFDLETPAKTDVDEALTRKMDVRILLEAIAAACQALSGKPL